jgi:hypothetical protein
MDSIDVCKQLYATNNKIYLLMGRIRICATKAQDTDDGLLCRF